MIKWIAHTSIGERLVALGERNEGPDVWTTALDKVDV